MVTQAAAGLQPQFSIVRFDYRSGDYMKAWHFSDDDGRLNLTFAPFKHRTAPTNLGIIFSEVDQMFGLYNGRVILDDGSPLEVHDLVGFAEEHYSRWQERVPLLAPKISILHWIIGMFLIPLRNQLL